nr:recombinase family protein [uncultured Flavobacterium sp.]
MKKVALFARVSTVDNQEYERQISDLTRVIKIDGYSENQIEIFAEKVSGYKKNEDRPELSRLFNMVEVNPSTFEAVYVTEVSRLGRNPRATKEIIERFCDYRIPIKILNPTLCTLNPDGTRNNFVAIMLSIAIEFSDIESKTMKTRMKSGKLQRAVEGKTGSNVKAFGYTKDENGKTIINQMIHFNGLTEADYVEQIFTMYQSGLGTHAIAKTLNQMGVPTKYHSVYENKIFKYKNTQTEQTANELKWSDVVIRQILVNPVYKGEPKIKIKDAVSEVIDGKKIILTPAEYTTTKVKIDQIISHQLFDECNELLKSKTNRNYLTTNEYLLKDIIRCGICGKKYLGKYTIKKDKVYKCTSYLPNNLPCGNRSINISLIESVIFDIVSNSESLIQNLDNPNDVLNQIKTELVIQEQQLKNEISELENKHKQAENLLKASTASKNPNFELYSKLEAEFQNEIDSINHRIKLLNKDILSKNITISNYDNESATKDVFFKAKTNRPELTSIFRQFIDKLVINKLDKDYIFVSIFFKIKGIVFKLPLKIFIYTTGIRIYGGRNEKKYMYLTAFNLANNPVYNKDSILMVDIEEIGLEFNHMIQDKLGFAKTYQMKTIEKENYIYINETDI